MNSAGRADPVPGTEPDDDEAPEPITAAAIVAGLANPATGLDDWRRPWDSGFRTEWNR